MLAPTTALTRQANVTAVRSPYVIIIPYVICLSVCLSVVRPLSVVRDVGALYAAAAAAAVPQ